MSPDRDRRVVSPQALTDADRRIVAGWAADCAERVLPLFEAEAPTDGRPRAAIGRLRAYAAGQVGPGEPRSLGGEANAAARTAATPGAAAAARAAGQAAAIAHMGAHALGAAAYAVRAACWGLPDPAGAETREIGWQLALAGEPVRRALRLLPPVGENRAGPLGPGLLSRGDLGRIIARLQDSLER